MIGFLAALPSALALWPIPRTLTQGTSNTRADQFSISAEGKSSPVIQNAIGRYLQIISDESFVAPVDYKRGTVKTSGTLNSLVVSVKSTDETLDLNTDESYTLDIPVNGKASLKAQSPYGVVRGLETFSQLVTGNGYSKAILNTPVHIEDSPVYPHRGLSFDTSRNFYSVKSILRILDAMSYNKMNTFHWHVVDSHSWPIESKTYPALHQKGAYSSSMTYYYNDVKRIIKYAKDRGIRVIPEFDVPGHTYIVGQALPDIMSCTNKLPNWDHYAAEPPSGQLNIAKPESIEFTNNIVSEYAKLFPDNVFHLGGDEVNRNCWSEDPDVQKYLAAHPGEDVESLLVNFYAKVHDHLATTGKTAYTWEETLFHSKYVPDNSTILQVWIDQTSVQKA
ncbi:Glucosamine-6-phosphate isomerase (Glucosamine-6-phosphate deaminase) (GNPDA) (GlcN6P deaminase), partial [Coemansia linderi]